MWFFIWIRYKGVKGGEILWKYGDLRKFEGGFGGS